MFGSSCSYVQERCKRIQYDYLLIISNRILIIFVLFCLLVYSCVYWYSLIVFLFFLVNKLGWRLVIFLLFGRYNNYYIYSCSSYGLIFGGGYDLYIVSYCLGFYLNFGYSYQLLVGYSYGSLFI